MIKKNFYINLDLKENRIINSTLENIKIDPRESHPSNGNNGKIYFNILNGKFYQFFNNSWTELKTSANHVSISGIPGLNASNVQEALENLNTQINNIYLNATSDAIPNSLVKRNQNSQFSVGTPTEPNHIATKQFVEDLINTFKLNFQFKNSVRALFKNTLNINFISENTENADLIYNSETQILQSKENGFLPFVDGLEINLNDRILFLNENRKNFNGIYKVISIGGLEEKWALKRAEDFNSPQNIKQNSYFWVEEGFYYKDTAWVLINDFSNPNQEIQLDVTELEFTQVSGLGQIEAGDGLSKNGNILQVNVDNQTLEIQNDVLRIKTNNLNFIIPNDFIVREKLHPSLRETIFKKTFMKLVPTRSQHFVFNSQTQRYEYEINHNLNLKSSFPDDPQGSSFFLPFLLKILVYKVKNRQEIGNNSYFYEFSFYEQEFGYEIINENKILLISNNYPFNINFSSGNENDPFNLNDDVGFLIFIASFEESLFIRSIDV